MFRGERFIVLGRAFVDVAGLTVRRSASNNTSCGINAAAGRSGGQRDSGLQGVFPVSEQHRITGRLATAGKRWAHLLTAAVSHRRVADLGIIRVCETSARTSTQLKDIPDWDILMVQVQRMRQPCSLPQDPDLITGEYVAAASFVDTLQDKIGPAEDAEAIISCASYHRPAPAGWRQLSSPNS